MKVIVIGRAPDNDIVIPDRYVSKHHMQLIIHDDGAVSVVDLNSRTGTFVNGRKIHGEQFLHETDTVKIGTTILPWMQYVQNFSEPDEEIKAKRFYQKKAFLIGVIIFLTLGLAGGGYYFYQHIQTNNNVSGEENVGQNEEKYKTISTNDFEMKIFDALETAGKTKGNQVIVYKNDSIYLSVRKTKKEDFAKENPENTLKAFKEKQTKNYLKKYKEISSEKKDIHHLPAIVSEFKSLKGKNKRFRIVAFIDGNDAYYTLFTSTPLSKKENTEEILREMIESFKLVSEDEDENEENEQQDEEDEDLNKKSNDNDKLDYEEEPEEDY